MKKIIIVSLCLGWVFVSAGASASFDCAKASSQSEKAVCSHPSLAHLDRELDLIYQKAWEKANAKGQAKLKNAQRTWLTRLEACKGHLPCIEGEYRRRMTQLQIEAGVVPVPEPVGYHCGDGGQLTVFFYNATTIPSVLIKRGDTQFRLLRVPSGSGAKYHGGDVEFWEHHGEATLIVHDQKSICHERAALK
jgi:uncharacterized protein